MALSICGQSVANLGELGCDKSRGVLKKPFIFNGEFASGDYATNTALLAKMVEFSKLSKEATNKIFPINEVQDIADASEANREGTLGLGYKTTLIEGKPSYVIKAFAGSDLVKRMRQFNNKTVRILEWDANNTLWGVKANGKFKGFQAKIFVTGNKAATGQNVEEGIATITISFLSTSEYYDNAYWAEIDGNIEDVVGLLDANMSLLSNVSNVHKIQVKIPGSNINGDYNVGPDYGTAIAALAANFSATIGGSALAITSITYEASTQSLVVTYSSSPYGSGSGTIVLTPPTPAQLDAGDVLNLELLPLSYAKP